MDFTTWCHLPKLAVAITSSHLLAYDKVTFPSQRQGWDGVGEGLSTSQRALVAMEAGWLGKAGPEAPALRPGTSLQRWVYLSPGRDLALCSISNPLPASGPQSRPPRLLLEQPSPHSGTTSIEESSEGCPGCLWELKTSCRGWTWEEPRTLGF